MRNYFLALAITAVVAVVSLVAAPAAVQAPTAAATASNPPRTPDGKPDLSGIWQVMNTAAWDIQDHSAQKGVPAGQGVVEGNDIPYQPWALAKKQENYDNRRGPASGATRAGGGAPRVRKGGFR
jgi:hypothetical protein